MHKIAKAEVHYGIGHQNSHCGPAYEADKNFCRLFISSLSGSARGLGRCEKVEGPISPVYWCKLWTRAQSK
jgi:hypothetical protein